MDLSEQTESFDGSRHFWEVARARFLVRMIRDYQPAARHWLDIGCGDGYLLEQLCGGQTACRRSAVDTEASPALVADFAARGIALEREFSAAVAASCDMVTLFDVLEHIADDAGYVAALTTALPAGATVAVTVPAFPALFSDHDRKLRHFRRYTRATLTAALRAGGLEIRESGYFFGSLLVARLVLCTLKRSTDGGIGGGAIQPRWLNRCLAGILTGDAAVCRASARFGMPLPGLSVYALCQKTSS